MGTHLQTPALERGTAAPYFSAHVFCGQVAAWIRIPLGMEVGSGPGDIALMGSQLLPHRKGHSSPLTFRPTSFWHGRPSQQLLLVKILILYSICTVLLPLLCISNEPVKRLLTMFLKHFVFCMHSSVGAVNTATLHLKMTAAVD